MPAKRTPRNGSGSSETGERPASHLKNGRKREKEILEVAVRLFYRQGYANTSVEDVASELGILKGSLYYYIRSKDDLLAEILEQVHEDLQAIVDGLAEAAGDSPLDRIATYVRRLVEYSAGNVERISVYYKDLDRLTEARRQDIRRRRRSQEMFLRRLLEEARDNGDIAASTDVALTTNCIYAVTNWPYTWYRPGGRVSQTQLADICVAFVLGGLTSR